MIIVGHGRLLAAKLLEMTEVPVLEIDLTEEQARAYRLADNKLNESKWDMDLVIADLKLLSPQMLDLTGFDSDLILEPEPEDDNVPQTPTEPKSALGDIYILGEHRVMCGDSTKIEDVEKLMDEKKAELLFTSPPYSDMREYECGKDLSVNNLVNFIPAFEPFAEYQVINLGIQRKNHEINQYWNEYIAKAKEVGYKFLSWNIWNREHPRSVAQQTSFIPIAHEWLFVFGVERKEIKKTIQCKTAGRRNNGSIRQKDGTITHRIYNIDTNKKINSVTTTGVESDGKHPAMYPVALPLEYILAMTNENVIDPFLGSGSTLIAAEKTGRICYGMELDPKYIDVIVQRYVDYTGNNTVIKNGQEITWSTN